MTYYELNLTQARAFFREAVITEDEHQVIVDGSKLQECHTICIMLTEQRAPIPLEIQAEANYYLSFGRSDVVALEYLTKAVSCCEVHETQTATPLPGGDFYEEALQEMHIALGAEHSEYGGVAVASTEAAEKSGHGGLLEARGLPTMTITASSPSSGPRRKLPTVRAKHVKKDNSSDQEKKL